MMKKLDAGDPETESRDLVADNIEQLQSLFPEAFAEGKIDFDVLKQLLGGAVDEREEKYGLNWHGKRQARQIALTPSLGTLRPCPEESVDWDTTQNLMIEGDNLEVLKLLQKSYAGKVKLIYIDPPYNTGRDFVYADDFRDNIHHYLRVTGQVDDSGSKRTTNSEASGRFHTDWLNMMYPRLALARRLLRDDGLMFVSIDEAEVANLRAVLDEIFGPERLVSELVWKNKYNAGALTKGFSSVHEYVLCYSRAEIANLTAPLGDDEISQYTGVDAQFAVRGGYVTQPLATNSKDPRPNLRYPITIDGREIWPEKQWIWSRERIEAAIQNDEVVVNESNGKTSVRVKQYLRDANGRMREMKPLSLMIGPYNQEGTKETEELFGQANVFSFPKPVRLVQHLASLTLNDKTEKDALVLDFFAGSGTTGQAVLEQNARDGGSRRFILVQLPEPLMGQDGDSAAAAFCERVDKPPRITELTKERLRRAGGVIRERDPMFAGDTGFRVFKLDSSNIRTWDADRDDLAQTLLDAVDHIKPGRAERDVLYELLLKRGLDLCAPVETRLIARRQVHAVAGGALFACLSETIARKEVESLATGIADWHKTLGAAGEAPIIFRDSAFENDAAKANMAAILEQHGLTNVITL